MEYKNNRLFMLGTDTHPALAGPCGQRESSSAAPRWAAPLSHPGVLPGTGKAGGMGEQPVGWENWTSAAPLARGCDAGCAAPGQSKGLVPAPGVCRGSRFLTGLCLVQSGLNGGFFSKRQRAEVVILFLSDSGLVSCVFNLNGDICVNRVAAEEFGVQTARAGAEEPMPSSRQRAPGRRRIDRQPQPFRGDGCLCAGLWLGRSGRRRGGEKTFPPRQCRPSRPRHTLATCGRVCMNR